MTEQAVIQHPDHRRPLSIQNLVPSLPERGKVKIGMKSARKVPTRGGKDFQPPEKIDHFRITTLQRGPDDNFILDAGAHQLFGPKPTELPIRLLYDNISLNFQSSYGCFIGSKMWCRGDGVTAMRLKSNDAKEKDRVQVQCPCPRKEPDYEGADKCKMNGLLSFLIDGLDGVGGVHKFRTTSYNTTVGIASSLQFIKANTGGVLANIPLKLCVRPKQATTPSGQQQTIYVVSVEFRGTLDQLRQIGHQVALDRAQMHFRIEHIEDEARALMLPAPENAPLPGDDAQEVIEEFYPEQVGAVEVSADAPPKPTRESVAAELQKPKEPEAPIFELVNQLGEISWSSSDAKAWAVEFDKIMKTAAGSGDEESLSVIIANNEATIATLPDATLQDELQDAISMYGHTAAMNAPKQAQGGRR